MGESLFFAFPHIVESLSLLPSFLWKKNRCWDRIQNGTSHLLEVTCINLAHFYSYDQLTCWVVLLKENPEGPEANVKGKPERKKDFGEPWRFTRADRSPRAKGKEGARKPWEKHFKG